MNTGARYKFIINVAYYTLITAIIYILVRFLFAYLFPFIIGLIITAVVQKPANYLSRKMKVSKGKCALVLVVLTYLVVIGILTYFIFKVGNFVYGLTINDNAVFQNIGSYVDDLISRFNNLPEFFVTFIRNLINSLVSLISDFAKSIVKALPMFLTSSLITVIASCYIAKDFDRFKVSISSVATPKYKRAAKEIKILFNENIKSIFIGYLKILMITFVLLFLGLLLLGSKHVLLYSALIAILDLLPVFGTGTALIPWSLYSFLASKYYFGIGLLILYAITVIVRNIIEPKIIGKQMGLHPLIALIAVFIGLKLLGFIGIFFAPLLTMIIYKMYDRGVFEILFGNTN